MANGYLTQAQVIELADAVIASGLDYALSRSAFVRGINPRYLATLPAAFGLPVMVQLLNDLGSFSINIRLADGSIPLRIWLLNAAALTGPTEQGKIFQRRLDEVDHQATGAPRVDAAQLPESKEVIVHQDDMVPYGFIAAGLKSASSVAKLSVPRYENGQASKLPSGEPVIYLGTGWLLTPELMVTNHHVVNARNENEPPASEADLKLQGAGTIVRFDFDADSMQGSDSSVLGLEAWHAALDYAVLRLPATARAALTRAPERLERKPDDYVPVNIIQHPEGGSKKFAIRNNLVTASTDTDLRYFTDTKRGSSGSPVFDDRWRVVALHRGATLAEQVSFQGKPVAWVNIGTHISTILADLKARYPTLAAAI